MLVGWKFELINQLSSFNRFRTSGMFAHLGFLGIDVEWK